MAAQPSRMSMVKLCVGTSFPTQESFGSACKTMNEERESTGKQIRAIKHYFLIVSPRVPSKAKKK